MDDDLGNLSRLYPRELLERAKAKGRTPERQAQIEENLARMNAGKAERVAAGDLEAKGGGRRKRKTEEQIRQEVFDELKDEVREELTAELVQDVRDALGPHRAKALSVLVALLESNNPTERRHAATKIVEWTDGKPVQAVVNEQKGPVEIVYRTEALGEAPDYVPAAWEADSEGGE